MATKKIYKNCTQNTYKVDDGVYSSSRPSSSEIANYRLKEQTYVKVNSSNQKVKKITTISYAKDGTGTANSVYKNASNVVISAPSDWNSYTDKSIIEKWTNGYLSGLLEDVIASGEITISNTADYYNGNNSEIIIYGYEFTEYSVLKNAVSDWMSNKTSTEAQYGEINTWNVSAITNMQSLFVNHNFTTNTTIDLNNWDVSNVTNMSYMFATNESGNRLVDLKISNWDVSSVTNMSYMFGRNNLGRHNPNNYTFDIANWDVSNVTNMNGMFSHSGFLRNGNIDFSNWQINPDAVWCDSRHIGQSHYGTLYNFKAKSWGVGLSCPSNNICHWSDMPSVPPCPSS